MSARRRRGTIWTSPLRCRPDQPVSGGSTALFEQYGVKYVYLSSYELTDYAVDTLWYDVCADRVFSSGSVSVFALRDPQI